MLPRVIFSFILVVGSYCRIESSKPNLPLSDVNVVIVTDVHSWVGGHDEKEPLLNADYGDVLSFYQRLRGYCDEANLDLWFVMNGDWIDGTGLAMNGDASYLVPLLERMPWDAINVGNHELYKKEVIEYMTRPAGFIDFFGEKYISSNVVHTNTMKPIGNRYRLLKGVKTTLVFAFLYNMKDNDPLVTVEEVGTVLEEDWFIEVLRGETYDAILILAHMDVRNKLVYDMLQKIRSVVGDTMPVQFITGHTHYRGVAMMDNYSWSFEAGKYLDTIGFVSYSTEGSTTVTTNASSTPLFNHVFIDANKDALTQALNTSTLDTSDGIALSNLIERVREELGLDEVVACTNQNYFLNRSLDDDDSLWGLFANQIAPATFSNNDVVVLDKGGWRYDLYGGRITVDNVLGVSPFNDSLHSFQNISGAVLTQLNASMNSDIQDYLPYLPDYIFAPVRNFTVEENFNLLVNNFDVQRIRAMLSNIDPDLASIEPIRIDPTTTSVWFDFLKAKYACQNNGKDQGYNSGQISPKRNSTHKGSPLPSDDDMDAFRLIFVIIAILTVISLGAVSINQHGKRWRHHAEIRESATFNALHEFEGAEDEDDDEDEGEFV